MKKISVKFFALFLVFLILITSLAPVVFAYKDENGTQSYNSITLSDALYVDGEKLYNRRGEEIRLRGLNLGGWLIMEDWFCPVSNDKRATFIQSVFLKTVLVLKRQESFTIYIRITGLQRLIFRILLIWALTA